MPKRRITWYVLADGSRARIAARREDGPGYDVVEHYDSAAAHVPTREIMSDRPGRVRESANAAHHGVEPQHDAHRERKAAFVHQLGTRLNAACAEDAFDELVLYADPRALGELRAALDERTRAKVAREFAKDLTKVPLAELDQHFAA